MLQDLASIHEELLLLNLQVFYQSLLKPAIEDQSVHHGAYHSVHCFNAGYDRDSQHRN